MGEVVEARFRTMEDAEAEDRKVQIDKEAADGQIYGWADEWAVVTMATELSEALRYLSFLSIS